MKEFCTALIIVLFSSSAYTSTSLDYESFSASFDHFVENEIAPKTQGYAIGVIVNGDTHITRVGGTRSVDSTERIDIDTVFRLASVSKTFTPAVIASNKQLSYDQAIRENLPNLKLSSDEHLQALTLGHVLSQTSGLFPHAYTNLIQDGVAYDKIISQLHKVNFICAPGKCYSYQNVAYCLAADAIAASLEQPYEQIVEQQLLKPLGMSSTSFGRDNFLSEENRASPHRWNRKEQQWQQANINLNYYRMPAAAGMNASLRDMMQWLRAQLGQYPELLTKTELARIHAPQVSTTRKAAHYMPSAWDGVNNTAYAYGWRTFDLKAQANGANVEGFVHHGGWVKGYRIEMVFNPSLNMGMVYLSNVENAFASSIVPSVLKMYIRNLAPSA
jgi:beta-lactamase class C